MSNPLLTPAQRQHFEYELRTAKEKREALMRRLILVAPELATRIAEWFHNTDNRIAALYRASELRSAVRANA